VGGVSGTNNGLTATQRGPECSLFPDPTDNITFNEPEPEGDKEPVNQILPFYMLPNGKVIHPVLGEIPLRIALMDFRLSDPGKDPKDSKEKGGNSNSDNGGNNNDEDKRESTVEIEVEKREWPYDY
jgi:hypothetical protein